MSSWPGRGEIFSSSISCVVIGSLLKQVSLCCRFDVLEQVCSAPDVLARVVAEVEQRRAFSSALQQVRLHMLFCTNEVSKP